ncbi:MAG: repressor LexA [Sedimentisphaerales bacterium]|nr:repressor LexA [Sedimentisphaerales bacterium]
METNTKLPKGRLTPRQLQLLTAITSSLAKHCYSPTIGELAERLGISRSTVFEHIGELRKKGLLQASPGKARSLNPTVKAQRLLSRVQESTSTGHCAGESSIPLLGCAAAGAALHAIENRDSLSLESYFGIDDETFALEVRGDSMIDDGINDGDYVVCRRRATAENGQLVVAIVDDENATIKRLHKEDSRVRLEAANENYAPIYSDNCRVEAVVVGLVRKL